MSQKKVERDYEVNVVAHQKKKKNNSKLEVVKGDIERQFSIRAVDRSTLEDCFFLENEYYQQHLFFSIHCPFFVGKRFTKVTTGVGDRKWDLAVHLGLNNISTRGYVLKDNGKCKLQQLPRIEISASIIFQTIQS